MRRWALLLVLLALAGCAGGSGASDPQSRGEALRPAAWRAGN
jgi:hypothetical protein